MFGNWERRYCVRRRDHAFGSSVRRQRRCFLLVVGAALVGDVDHGAMDFGECATGALLGLAVGDALGAPLEFSSPAEARIRCESGLEMTGNSLWDPGEWTDDTAMALALAESIAEHGLIDLDDVALRYVAWASSGPNTSAPSHARRCETLGAPMMRAATPRRSTTAPARPPGTAR